MIEKLNKDKNGNFSSRMLIKSGPNRGRSRPETSGITWIYVGSYSDHALSDVRCAHWTWAQKLDSMGYRVGVTYDHMFYLCMKNGKIAMRDGKTLDLKVMMNNDDVNKHD
jgi:hypothetical protein